ncbi:riboflavin synthase [Kaistia dalseonensis]|uniref:Riboflavin synthase n=1 Tax=Kaistia dalseonensis TaxID=410840 RepID=A0ABU0H3U2_9HYPH|nr:riboflavin synthase [Kaistia dalseonensis]MCX5493623.1 riboflavin synthase [Kaistia dalseonensis]MDQ0436184.1 riboflavin synthase [Kaistia dalseonensis]
MFTGIISDVGTVEAVQRRNDVNKVTIDSKYDPETIAIGASIACAGVCLTVISVNPKPEGGTKFDVEAAPETLALTEVGGWDMGTKINLERSLKIGDELGGHLVSGHVDGVATIISREDLGETTRFVFEAPANLARFIATKGSVALDGTSLTVNWVEGNRFSVLLIPHTLLPDVTTWGKRQAGEKVHLEVDQMARYVARLNEAG